MANVYGGLSGLNFDFDRAVIYFGRDWYFSRLKVWLPSESPQNLCRPTRR